MERSIIPALAALALSACMYSPYDGQQLSTPGQVVEFSGYGDAAGQSVDVQVARPLGSPCNDVDLNGVPLCIQQYEWITIAQARTSSSVSRIFDDGSSWYPWTVNASVPGYLWQHESATRMQVRVRAMIGGSSGYTVGSNYATCYSEHHADAIDWRDHCSVGEDARIYAPAP